MRLIVILLLLLPLAACQNNDHHWLENAHSFTLKNAGYRPLQQGPATSYVPGQQSYYTSGSQVGVGGGGLSQSFGQ